MSEERSLADLIAPEILLAQRHEGAHGHDPRFDGTKQLMLAVLVDALQCLQKRRTITEVDAWIEDRKARGPFAFETVCETLEIDADYLRNGVREWRYQLLSDTGSQRQVRHQSNRRSGRIGLPVRRARRRAGELP